MTTVNDDLPMKVSGEEDFRNLDDFELDGRPLSEWTVNELLHVPGPRGKVFRDWTGTGTDRWLTADELERTLRDFGQVRGPLGERNLFCVGYLLAQLTEYEGFPV